MIPKNNITRNKTKKDIRNMKCTSWKLFILPLELLTKEDSPINSAKLWDIVSMQMVELGL